MSDQEEEGIETGEEDNEVQREGEELEDEEKREEEEEEEEEEVTPNPLNEPLLAAGLSLLCKTGDGLSHAYVKLDVHEREITDIDVLKSFIHLRYVDISGNYISDMSSLNSLTHLLYLRADQNKLQSAQLNELPYLQIASFKNNRIKTMEGVNHPLLEQLSLSSNAIASVRGLNPEILTKLHTLELRQNKLTSLEGLYLPCLKNLFLADNQLKTMSGICAMEHLTTVHVRGNALIDLDGFSEEFKNLQYINMRENALEDLKEVKKLECLPCLRAVVFSDNPISAEDEYRLDVLINLRRLERLDKDEYHEEERLEAQEIYERRRQEELEAGAQVVVSDTEGGADD